MSQKGNEKIAEMSVRAVMPLLARACMTFRAGSTQQRALIKAMLTLHAEFPPPLKKPKRRKAARKVAAKK